MKIRTMIPSRLTEARGFKMPMYPLPKARKLVTASEAMDALEALDAMAREGRDIVRHFLREKYAPGDEEYRERFKKWESVLRGL